MTPDVSTSPDVASTGSMILNHPRRYTHRGETSLRAANGLPIVDVRVAEPSPRTVIASVVNDNFVAGFVVMERSLRATNPDWTWPIIAISSTQDPLSEEARDVIRSQCDNVHFACTNEQAMTPVYDYAASVIGTPQRLWPAFSILDVTRWSAFDRVIALDSDMIVRGSLAELLHAPCPFNAVRATDSITGKLLNYFNTGVMVMNRPMLIGGGPSELVDQLAGRVPRPGTGKADQAILNILINNRTAGYLPARFNYTKRSVMAHLIANAPEVIDDPDAIDQILTDQDVRILHYVGEKPWNAKVREAELAYGAIDELWHRALEEYGGKDLLRLLERQRRGWSSQYHSAVRTVSRRSSMSDTAFEKAVARTMGL